MPVIEVGTYYQVEHPLLSTVPAVDMIFPGASPPDPNPLAHCDFILTVFAGWSNL